MKRSRLVFFSLYVLLAFSGAVISGCASQNLQNSGLNIFKEDGYGKLLERQQASMSDELTSAEKKLPEMTAADYERLGDVHSQQGKFDLAFLQYTKALQKKPDSPEVLYKRGVIFLRRGMNDTAIKDFQTILSKDSSHALAHQGMGQAYFKMRNYPEAEKQFQLAIKSNPKLWVSYNFLGVLYDYQQRPADAIAQYKSAIAVRPGDAALYNNLGVSYSLMGDYEKAVQAFGEGLSVNPRDAKLTNNLGMVLCRLGRHLEAVEAFRNSGDEAQAYNNVGCFFLRDGEYEKAVRAFERAIQLRAGYYAQANENLRKAETALHARASISEQNRGPSGKSATSCEISADERPAHMDIKETPIGSGTP